MGNYTGGNANGVTEEALTELVYAVNEYEESLMLSFTALTQAASACLEAMGGDPLSTRYKNFLTDDIGKLQKEVINPLDTVRAWCNQRIEMLRRIVDE